MYISDLAPLFHSVSSATFASKNMKRYDALSLGYAYEQLNCVLTETRELLEVTFHYGMGVRVHLETARLGICHGQELLQHFLSKAPVPRSSQYYLFRGVSISHKGKEGLCGYVKKLLNHPPLLDQTYVFVSRDHKCLTCLTQTQREICLESHYLCEGTYDLPPREGSSATCVPLSPAAFQVLLSKPKKGRKKGLKRQLFTTNNT